MEIHNQIDERGFATQVTIAQTSATTEQHM